MGLKALSWLDEEPPVSTRYRGLIEHGNRPLAREDQLRADFSRQVATYLNNVRVRAPLPPHAYPENMFFTEILRARDVAELAREDDRRTAPFAPVASLRQTTSLVRPDEPKRQRERVRLGRHLQPKPDPGRRVQLWWDERAPGQPPLRPDEVIRFIRRGAWRGRVEEMLEDRLVATVWDLERSGAVEEVELFLALISAEDQHRAAPGAFFYWTVGYTENGLGERTAASRLRFARVRRDAPRELAAEADQAARDAVKALDPFDQELDPEDG